MKSPFSDTKNRQRGYRDGFNNVMSGEDHPCLGADDPSDPYQQGWEAGQKAAHKKLFEER